jgi:hypothetical protein
VRPHAAQKNALKPWQQQQWVIPPPAKAEFVWAMADGREVYTRPDAPRRPPGCRDETSQPWVAETREPLPAAPGRPQRGDDEDARQGPATLGLGFEPWAGQRRVHVTERRTAVDVAPLSRAVVEEPSPHAEQMVLVLDNLHTHPPASLSEALAPAAARRVRERLELQHTPKPGSWLTMAETARRVLATPCVDRRIPDPAALNRQVAAWARRRNAAQGRGDWRFTTHAARINLKRLSPSIQLG